MKCSASVLYVNTVCRAPGSFVVLLWDGHICQ